MTRPLGYSVERRDDGRIALTVPTGEHPDWGSEFAEHALTVERARALRDALTAALGEESIVERVGAVLSDAGCECACSHDFQDHGADCIRCLGCRVEAALSPEVLR